MDFTLRRLSQTAEGTYGHLCDDQDRLVCCTVELPWKDNQHAISCIPAGAYALKRAMHHQKYEVFEVCDVPNRDAIHIHIANLPSELLGCIAPGTDFGDVTNAKGDHGYGVLESGPAFTKWMEYTTEPRTLTIIDP